jgi:cytoskeleton protein RodZ
MDESLGKKLRAAREASGITVDDAVYRAKLPRAVVEALEAEDFGFFTSPLYARSFLKQYGDYIGMDVTPWIDDLEPTSMIDGEAVEAFINISDSAPLPITREKAKGSRGGGVMPLVWLIVIVGGMAWGSIKLFKEFDQKTSEDPELTQESTPPVPKPEKPPQTNGGAKPETDENPAAASPEQPRRAIIVREE